MTTLCDECNSDVGHRMMNWMRGTDFFLLLSDTMHSTSSSLQFVHGAPCSVTLHLTLRARQHWHALEALLFTERPVVFPSRPAWAALRFGGWRWWWWSDGDAEHSDMAALLSP